MVYIATLDEKSFEFIDGAAKKYVVELPGKEQLKCWHTTKDAYNQVKKGAVLWASGGGTYLINDEWIPLVKRDGSSPTNPNKLTIATGRADSIEELYCPDKIARELFEEIIILEGGNIIAPIFCENSFPLSNEQIQEVISGSAVAAGIKYDNVEAVPATVPHDMSSDTIVVKSTDGLINNVIESFLHYEKDTGEVNFLAVVKLNLQDISVCSFKDAEVVVDDQKSSILDREIYLFHLPTKKLYSTSADGSLYMEEEKLISLTPHARYLIDLIENKLDKEQRW
ncbi:MAG: hypothetical protein AB8G05_13040 [Oligoflexales bacterium]